MSNLRDLSLIVPPIFSSYAPKQLLIANGREGVGVTTGNTCCCWKVPSGTTWATFEMYGSGGDGAGACCCAGPARSGGRGNYTVKTVAVTAASIFFNICVGMSGCCSQSQCGTCGFPSYVTNCAGTTIGCAAGGLGGCAVCGHMGGQSCFGICCASQIQGCQGLGDMMYPTVTEGDVQHNYCTQHSFPHLPGTYQYAPNTRHGLDSCAVGMTVSGCYYWNASTSNATSWPGGGGAGAQACGGGCCWGHWGTPGMVLITYG